jgi:hypothetical protein
VAALWVPSIAGLVQVAVRLLPLPWFSVAAPGVFGAYVVGVAIAAAGVGSPPGPRPGRAHLVCGGGELGWPKACTATMRLLTGGGVLDFGILMRLL